MYILDSSVSSTKIATALHGGGRIRRTCSRRGQSVDRLRSARRCSSRRSLLVVAYRSSTRHSSARTENSSGGELTIYRRSPPFAARIVVVLVVCWLLDRRLISLVVDRGVNEYAALALRRAGILVLLDGPRSPFVRWFSQLL